MTDNNSSCCQDCGSDIKIDDRQQILSKLNDIIDYLHTRGLNGRYTEKSKNSDGMRVKYLRAAAYACNIYSTISKDIELDEMKEELETMKEHISNLYVDSRGMRGSYDETEFKPIKEGL